MHTDAASDPEADAEELRLQRLVRDGFGLWGLSVASRYRQRRLAALRAQLGARAWNGLGVPPAELVELRARVGVLEEIERAESSLWLALLARITRSGSRARRGPPTTMMA